MIILKILLVLIIIYSLFILYGVFRVRKTREEYLFTVPIWITIQFYIKFQLDNSDPGYDTIKITNGLYIY